MLFMGLLGDQRGGGRGVVSSVLGIMRKRCGYCLFYVCYFLKAVVFDF